MVAINSTVGNAENSSGAWMNKDVIRIKTEKVIEMASAKSSNNAGSGRMSITRMAIMPSASAMSLRRSMVPRSLRRDNVKDRSPPCAEVASVMSVDRSRRLRSRDSKLCTAAGGPPALMIGTALASNIAPEGAVDTLRPPRQNVPGIWLLRR